MRKLIEILIFVMAAWTAVGCTSTTGVGVNRQYVAPTTDAGIPNWFRLDTVEIGYPVYAVTPSGAGILYSGTAVNFRRVIEAAGGCETAVLSNDSVFVLDSSLPLQLPSATSASDAAHAREAFDASALSFRYEQDGFAVNRLKKKLVCTLFAVRGAFYNHLADKSHSPLTRKLPFAAPAAYYIFACPLP